MKGVLTGLDMLYIVLFLHQTTTAGINPALALSLYIVLFLHQTTTSGYETRREVRCISYYSYIKPQPSLWFWGKTNGCISYYSYIKPQLQRVWPFNLSVVYRTIPTSNHNWGFVKGFTTKLYIVLFLHQTTTYAGKGLGFGGCISYYSYIKPQPYYGLCCWIHVVYRTIPTSNHNLSRICSRTSWLYIVLFLHQTTTLNLMKRKPLCCISYYSYIKPQLQFLLAEEVLSCISYYSYIKPQHTQGKGRNCRVVYRTIPTSNHNFITIWWYWKKLYIVLFLHQTTTYNVDIADNQHITITFINKK